MMEILAAEDTDCTGRRISPIVSGDGHWNTSGLACNSGSANRRTPTPTKQISLQTVRRKNESLHLTPPPLPRTCWTKDSNKPSPSSGSTVIKAESSSLSKAESSSLSIIGYSASGSLKAPPLCKERRALGDNKQCGVPQGSKLGTSKFKSNNSCSDTKTKQSSVPQGTVQRISKVLSSSNEKVVGLGESDSSSCNNPNSSNGRMWTAPSETLRKSSVPEDEASSSEESGDNEPNEVTKAPNELLMEFISCLMDKDYENAKKLCQMILLYEPTNPEALSFRTAVDERLQLDAESAASAAAEASEDAENVDKEIAAEESGSDDDSDDDEQSDDDDDESTDNESDGSEDESSSSSSQEEDIGEASGGSRSGKDKSSEENMNGSIV